MSEDTLPLFGRALARTTDPLTSHDAAAKTDRHVGRLEGTVRLALINAGARGATTKELAVGLHCERDSISPRMKQLETRGLIKRTDERREHAIVWVAVDL